MEDIGRITKDADGNGVSHSAAEWGEKTIQGHEDAAKAKGLDYAPAASAAPAAPARPPSSKVVKVAAGGEGAHLQSNP